MIKIRGIRNEYDIHLFKFDIVPNIHNQLINFLSDLHFSETELTKIDTPFSELKGEYLYVKKDNMKIHFFITEERINMVIDSSIPQEKLFYL